MAGFGEISRMNLADIEKKFPEMPEETGEEALSPELALEEEALLEELAGEEDTDEEEGEKEEIPPEPKKMAAPSGEHYFVDTEIEEADLRSFMYKHTYSQPLILICSVLVLVLAAYSFVKGSWNRLYCVFAVVIMDVIYPYSIGSRAKTAKKNVEAYQHTFHYMIDEVGVHLELALDAVDVDWKYVGKTRFLNDQVVLYTGKSNAFLIPYRAMGANKDAICNMIRKNTGK